jgi:CRP-like cAMP-binding protein
MRTEFDLQILGRTELFHGIDKDVMTEARDASFRKRLAAGDTLVGQGESASAFYVVVVGRLRATQTTSDGQQIIIRYIGPGDLAGYAALSGSEQHPATIAAIEETHLMGWNTATIRGLMTKHSSLAMNALSALGTRYREMQTRLREVATERVEQRIAHSLLRLAKSAGRITTRGIDISIPLSRQDLAEMSGTTLYTVSRILSAWEGAGFVEIGRRRVMVREPAALQDIAAESG